MVDLFRGLITDEGINKVRDISTTQGWKIAPYQFSFTSATQGAFSTTRTTASMQSTWYSGYFSSIDKLENNKILLTIKLTGDESGVARNITEIYVTATTSAGAQPFLYSLIQPTATLTFQPGVGMELSFILTLTNTNKADMYTIEYIDQTKLENYQLKKEKGQPSGYAPLGADGIVPDDYLPLRDNLPLGTIVPIMCTAEYKPQGYLPCDNTEYYYTEYQSFYTEYLLTGLIPTCTYQEYQADILAYGSCGKFAIDTVRATFKTPYIKDGTHIQQALSDGELSKLYKAGLPNIKSGDIYWETATPGISGPFNITKTGNGSDRSAGTASDHVQFNASLANPIYGNSTTVQPESVALRYFVIVAHGLIKKIDIIDDIVLHNPFSLFDCKYSEHQIVNASWLLSDGEFHSKFSYPTAYEKLFKLYSREEILEGFSVKVHTDSTITDYDFVINITDQSFRLPIKSNLASGKAVVGNGMTLGMTNGIHDFGAYTDTSANNTIYAASSAYGEIINNATHTKGGQGIGTVGITTDPTKSGMELADSDLYLYYYVGETIDQANLLGAGGIIDDINLRLTTIENKVPKLYMVPDWKNKSGVQLASTTYTAETNGFVSFDTHYIGNFQPNIDIFINGTRIYNLVWANCGNSHIIILPVAKGDTYRMDGKFQTTPEIYFIPTKEA